jgi:TPR repeat protein
MQMFRSRAAVLAATLSLAFCFEGIALEAQPFASATAAYRLGMASLKAGDVKAAIPALDYAADRGVLGAQLKLAKIYANGNGVGRDDAKAFYLYRQIANQRADIASSSPIARYVGEAFVSLGEYYREGLPEAGLDPNPKRAADLFRHAASYFGNADAQYALARLYLDGEGVEKNVGLAVNWLATAAKKRHAAAQATLGELLWRGDDVVRQRSARGLALIMLARVNAKESGKEPKWILDLYRQAVAAADPKTLEEARGLTAEWGGGAIAVDLAPADNKAVADQLIVPASGESADAAAPAMRPAADAVVSDGVPASSPRGQGAGPFSFAPARPEPSELKP